MLLDIWASQKIETISIRECASGWGDKKIIPKKDGKGICLSMQSWACLRDNIEAIDKDLQQMSREYRGFGSGKDTKNDLQSIIGRANKTFKD